MTGLSEVERYATAGLFALALSEAQRHQLGDYTFPDPDSESPVVEESWSGEKFGLCEHVFRTLKLDSRASESLQRVVSDPAAQIHLTSFLQILATEEQAETLETRQAEGELEKAVEAMAVSFEEEEAQRSATAALVDLSDVNTLEKERSGLRSHPESGQVKGREEEGVQPVRAGTDVDERGESDVDALPEKSKVKVAMAAKAAMARERREAFGFPRPEIVGIIQRTRLTAVYELLTASLADLPEEREGKSHLRPGYDARQRAAVRLVAAWLDVSWSKMASLECMVAIAAYQLQHEREAAAAEEEQKKSSSWSWKKGALVGGTAVAAGAVLAITGGLAAPAIAAGLAAVSPTLGVVPVLGTAFAGLATAAGTTVGSAAVISAFGAAGAGLGGYKMSRRIGDVEEFQFVELGTKETMDSPEASQRPDPDADLSTSTSSAREGLEHKDLSGPTSSLEGRGGAKGASELATLSRSESGNADASLSRLGKRWSWSTKGRKGGLEGGKLGEQGEEAQLAGSGTQLERPLLEPEKGASHGQRLQSSSTSSGSRGHDSVSEGPLVGPANELQDKGQAGQAGLEKKMSTKWLSKKWTSKKDRQIQGGMANEFRPRLAVAICVSGFVRSLEEYREPWGEPYSDLETYALLYESKHLIPLSTALEDMLTNTLVQKAMTQGAMLTVLSTLATAMAWPLALVGALNMIDGRWTLAYNRSEKAGKILADVLLKHTHGDRPVTLMGYSMGSLVIFSCLERLAAKKAHGIVERVVLLGAPLPAKDQRWAEVRKVVAGRFVNGYNSNDWTLGLVHRSSFLISGVAGIQAVETPGIENIDITAFLKHGHSSYCTNLRQILAFIDIDSYFPAFPPQHERSSRKKRLTNNEPALS